MTRALLVAALFLAQGAAAQDAPLAARYATKVCAARCESRDWFLWRDAQRIEIRDASGALGEIWRRDAKGRLSYVYLEPAQRRGIEYRPVDLELLRYQPSWGALESVVSPAELGKLKRTGETKALGRSAVVYKGAGVRVVWIPELRLAAKVTRVSGARRTVTELRALPAAGGSPLPTSETDLADYRIVDFADLGDMETSPAMAWLKQARAAPGQGQHDH